MLRGLIETVVNFSYNYSLAAFGLTCIWRVGKAYLEKHNYFDVRKEVK